MNPRKITYYIFTVILLGTIWIILTEDLSTRTILTGLILGCISLAVTDNLIHLDYYNSIRSINLLILIRYIIYLFSQIYISGFSTIKRVISGKVNVGIIDIETQLHDDLHIAILANSITLTPGTVTIDRQGQKLKVLYIDCSDYTNEEDYCDIKKQFETILMGERSVS